MEKSNTARSTEQRALLRRAVEAVNQFLETDPLKSEEHLIEDEAVDTIYSEAKNFIQSVENAGYDF